MHRDLGTGRAAALRKHEPFVRSAPIIGKQSRDHQIELAATPAESFVLTAEEDF